METKKVTIQGEITLETGDIRIGGNKNNSELLNNTILSLEQTLKHLKGYKEEMDKQKEKEEENSNSNEIKHLRDFLSERQLKMYNEDPDFKRLVDKMSEFSDTFAEMLGQLNQSNK